MEQWLSEHGRYDGHGRPFRQTASAIDMKQFNILVNRKVSETLKMLNGRYH